MARNPRTYLKEGDEAGRTFIVVDVQPEYASSISFIPQLVDYITSNHEKMSRLVFLYNGADTIGLIDEGSYKEWWIENELPYEIIDQSIFYDKGYAFFRYCMDSYIDEDAVANFVRFMYENNVHDSRDMDRDMWAKYLREYRRTDKREVYELLKHSGDCVHIPDLMDFIRRFNNITLCGGHMDACLKEVEIALKALRKPYSLQRRFVY